MKMKKIRIELEIEVKGDATFDEVKEFMEYEMHLSWYCSVNNPFIDEDGDCDYVIEKFEIEEL